MQGEKLRDAVRELRLHFKREDGKPISQTEFGRLLGKSLNTIQRYETLVPPKGRTLLTLQDMAVREGLINLALIFKEALNEEMGERTVPASVELLIIRHVATDCLVILRDATVPKPTKISIASEALELILDRTSPAPLRPEPTAPTEIEPVPRAPNQAAREASAPPLDPTQIKENQ